MKQYDQAYFDRWYRSRQRVAPPEWTRRKAALALAAAECYLERPVRRVLDVGCGEGQWRAVLRRMRPGLQWTGVDPSDYVVRRFGRRRNIRKGGFGDLPELGLRGRFDLIVSASVIHYVSTPDLRRGLATVVGHLDGVAWLEAHTTDDAIHGDLEGWYPRSERQYRRIFKDAGLAALGMHCWVRREWVDVNWVGQLECFKGCP
jgi:SAM-dependent methyltransferase